MPSKLLTDTKLKRAKPADGEWLNDGDGLRLRVRESGKDWYFIYRKEKGANETKLNLGRYPTITLEEARAKADELRKQRINGEDPQFVREAEAAEKALHAARMTFAELFTRWEKIQLRERKDGGAEIRRAFEKDVLPLLGKLYADEITRQHIARLLNDIVERGAKRMANRTLSDLRQCFGYAIGAGLLENDPTSHLKKTSFGGKEEERDRILNDSELRQLLQTALPACNLSFKAKAAVQVLLGTAARVGELLRAERSHIDLIARTWHIPAENAKNGSSHTIYLSDFAANGFEQLLSILDHPQWLFVDRSGSNHVCVKTLTKQISDRQTTAAMSGRSKNTQALMLSGGKWTPHDLRRTAATQMGELGVAPHIIEKCLNHKEENKIKRTYQLQRQETEQREAFILLGERLALLANTETDNVILLNHNAA